MANSFKGDTVVAVDGLEFSQHLIQHHQTLLRYIRTFVPRYNDAEEVLQRVAISLWEKAAEFDPQREFLPWALRFAHIQILNFRKEKARDRLVFSEETLNILRDFREELIPFLETQREVQREALKECLRRVRTEELSLLQRRYGDSGTMVSLAEETGSTVKSLYRRLDRVRELVGRCVKRRMALKVE
ncbi:MAG TPA: sigma-70 family RNA polymerase sigma factor [Planctomicrobium sp.]|nr:sigma-70 family RNA polymerase sigma factor [Planctomicrobium sp.]